MIQIYKNWKLIENVLFGHGLKWYGQSVSWTLKLTVSLEWTDGINWFLHVDTDSQKLKPDQKFIGWA